MIGRIIAHVRESKKMSKTELAKATKIDVGHITHIEKEERNPSHSALRAICDALKIPYEPMMHTYDKDLTEEQKSYNVEKHINYDLVPIFGSIEGFSKCPEGLFDTSFVFRAFDDTMSPRFEKGDYLYTSFNTPLDNKDIGLFLYEEKLIVRKFIVRKTDLVLRAESKDIKDIILTKDSDFYIVGKILGVKFKNMPKYEVF